MIPKGDFKLQVIRQCVDTFSTLRSTKEFPKETRGQSEFGFPLRGAVKSGLTFYLISITSENRRLKCVLGAQWRGLELVMLSWA